MGRRRKQEHVLRTKVVVTDPEVLGLPNFWQRFHDREQALCEDLMRRAASLPPGEAQRRYDLGLPGVYIVGVEQDPKDVAGKLLDGEGLTRTLKASRA